MQMSNGSYGLKFITYIMYPSKENMCYHVRNYFPWASSPFHRKNTARNTNKEAEHILSGYTPPGFFYRFFCRFPIFFSHYFTPDG